MSHPFEEGKLYRNRIGQYEVEEIDGDRMVIRYVDGGTLETSVNIQARIWENIQFEEQMARTEERRRQAQAARQAVRRRSTGAGQTRTPPTFDGFVEGDFDTEGRGIAWSGRRDLGRVLAYQLNRRTGEPFGPWIVPYQSEVHVARKDRYSRDTRELEAAFFVSTSEDGVSYGFYIGKPGGKVKPTWPWAVLLSALSEDKSLRESLRSAMEKRDLSLVVYGTTTSYEQVGRVKVEKDGFVWHEEDAQQELAREMTGKQLADHLATLAPDKRSGLYLGTQVSAEEAIEAEGKIAGQIAAVCESLLPLYDASGAE
ncbi:MAG: hypothetical protein PVG11_01120 [Anaerolineae bacterium]|jgi:hypothetical protein